MNIEKILKMKKYSILQFPTLLFVLAASFMSLSCADEDVVKVEDNNVKDGVSFSVTDVQDVHDSEMLTRAAGTTTYLTHSVDFNEVGTSDMCLEESTIPGVNPKKPTPQTRAMLKSSIDANFGVLACKNGSSWPDFFYNKEVNKYGQMLQPEAWTSEASTLKFYAVYPYMDGTNVNQKLVQATTGSMPYVAFEASTDIAHQTDLLIAETAELNYTPTGGTPHVVPLQFYHALTAIRFGIGQNLSWNKIIKSIEFQGVYKDGRYNLVDRTWSNYGSTENFKLDNINKPTAGTQNTVIVKDGNTFLMVPQTVPAGAKIVVTFTDGTYITANIGGKIWAPGTTKTYMMTEKNSDWEYKIEATDPDDISYDKTTSYWPYTIKSYRKDPTTNTFQAVKWKVVSYQESKDNGSTWSAESADKPNWLSNISLTEGEGGTDDVEGKPTVTPNVIDYLDLINKALNNAPQKGSASKYYNLANQTDGGDVVENTANCYVISAPGYYRIPLVYGNAIKNKDKNDNAYKTINTGQYILSHFKDHNEQPITDPWITETNGGANKPDAVKLVWADEKELVETSSLGISADGKFLQFHAIKGKLKNGNAVIAATKDGVVVWSWHLWFTEQSALNTTKITNFQNKEYNLMNEALGYKYNVYKGTEYKAPRKVRVRVRQLVKSGTNYKEATFIITQREGNIKDATNTFYQFGRKDPFSAGEYYIKEGVRDFVDNVVMSIKNSIQNPGTFYGGNWYNKEPPKAYTYLNLWSINYSGTSYVPVVKTIYDPCPPGFHVPTTETFTGFSKTGRNTNNPTEFNNLKILDYCGYFYNKLTSPDAVVTIPLLGYIRAGSGSIDTDANYWEAESTRLSSGNGLYFMWNSRDISFLSPLFSFEKSNGVCVRPVTE